MSIPGELVESFARGGGVIFVGAGLSMAAGYPGWATLVDPLRAEVEECPPNASYPDIAQFFEWMSGRGFLIQRLRQELERPQVEPTDIHRLLMQLPVGRIYTTNFDDLIELTARELNLKLDVVVNGADLSLLQPDRLHLVKVHGDLAQPDSVTITADDYELFSTRKPGLANILKMDLQTRVVLFMGYGFNDENLKLILAQARHQGGNTPRNRFALVVDPSPSILMMMRNKGLIPVVASSEAQDKTAAVERWLAEFIERIRNARPKSDPRLASAGERTHNLPPMVSDFLGREEELREVMEGLASRYPLVAVEGFAGVGKTSLAIRVGHACLLSDAPKPPNAVLFDYVVWVSAKDKPDQAQWLDDVLNAIANTTGFLAISQLPPGDMAKKRNQVELLLESFRILLIIDNLETIQDDVLMGWLEAIPAPSKVLVTTRNSQLNQKAYAVSMGGLRPIDALSLLKTRARRLGIAPPPNDRRLGDLGRVTGGNPQAMRLAMGLVRGGLSLDDVVNGLDAVNPTAGVDPLFKGIFESSWNLMSETARAFLLTTPLFVGVGSIRRDALVATADLGRRPFDTRAGLEECVRLGLLEIDPATPRSGDEQRFIVHPMTRSFAHSQWAAATDFETSARRRLVAYFQKLVEASVVRDHPSTPYWNALVSEGMLKVDPEWPSILEVMRWCDDNRRKEDVFHFTLMLVHYMDSRFYNHDRLYFVEQCVHYASESNNAYEEALLRIDALGWTFGEESRFPEAIAQIEAGMSIASGLDPEAIELMALGWAWLARVEIEQEHVEEAELLIKRALDIESPPWIRCRVLMAKGDIELKCGRGNEALTYYQDAAAASVSYGDEGRGYQTKPRIGLAFLATGDYSRAETTFRELSRFENMEIAQLYGEYGLAMVAYQRGEAVGAGALVEAVRKRLLRRTSSNLLLNMTQKLQADLERRHA